MLEKQLRIYVLFRQVQKVKIKIQRLSLMMHIIVQNKKTVQKTHYLKINQSQSLLNKSSFNIISFPFL